MMTTTMTMTMIPTTAIGIIIGVPIRPVEEMMLVEELGSVGESGLVEGLGVV